MREPVATVDRRVDWSGWVERWDTQQRGYVPQREERFTVLLDALEAVVPASAPVVLDLGCGLGSLTDRLLRRRPGATVVGVDRDPVLLALAGATVDTPGARFVDADLRAPGWLDALGLDGPVDAAVSTTALHWLDEGQLRRLAVDLAQLVRPGGVVLDGDHLRHAAGTRRLAAAARAVGEARATRFGREPAAETWEAWWTAVRADPRLADVVAARDARSWDHSDAHAATEEQAVRALRDAGFAEVGRLWQYGDDRLLAAVR